MKKILVRNIIFFSQVGQRDVETEKRLKKDLKRTKVLLADAQIMLDHLKSNAPSKREIAQLKNQVCLRSLNVQITEKKDILFRAHKVHKISFFCKSILDLDLGWLTFVPHLLSTFFPHSLRSQSSPVLLQSRLERAWSLK